MIQRCHQLALRIIQLLKLRLHRPLGLTKNFHFPSSSSVISPNEIEGSGTDSGVKQGTVFNAEIASPEPDKGFLHHVFGIRRAPHPLAGEQDQPGRELRKTDFPIFMGSDILHDPSRSLLLRRRQLSNLFVTDKFKSWRRLKSKDREGSWRMSLPMKIGKSVFRSSRPGWSCSPGSGCGARRMPKTWCRKPLSGSGDAISALKTVPCFTPLSVPLPSISFGEITEELDGKWKFLVRPSGRCSRNLSNWMIRSASWWQRWIICREINAKSWS